MNGRRVVGSRVGHNQQLYTFYDDDIQTCGLYEVYDTALETCRPVYQPADTDNEISHDVTNNSVSGNETSPIDDNCAYLELNSSEYLLLESGDLFELATNRSYPEKYFHRLSNGNALVCTNLTQNYTATMTKTGVRLDFKFSKAQSIVSFIGQLLSIVALATQLLVYSLLSPLRNLAGKSLMCLTSSLMLAQLLFLIGSPLTHVHDVCVGLAVAVHYLYLASFAWMNVLSFDIYRTFSKTRFSANKERDQRKFRVFLGYGYLSPLVIVVCAIIVNYTVDVTSALNPNYGDGLCWITQRRALVVFFGAPLLLLLCANTAFYTLTVYNVYQASKSGQIASHTSQERNVNQLKIYVKLCFVMGLTWLFAFVASFAEVEFLWYIYIILNSLQGVFICVMFVVTSRVLRLLREKYSVLRGRASTLKSRDHTTTTGQSTQLSMTVAQRSVVNVAGK